MKRLALLVLVAGCGSEMPRTEELGGPWNEPAIESADPALAVDPHTGETHLAWVAGDSGSWSLYHARSGDAGTSWSPAIRIAGGATEVIPHSESSPRLVTGPAGKLALIWASSVPVASRKWPVSAMRLARSEDGGRTWTAPMTLSDAAGSHQFHGAAWTGDSTLLVAWLGERVSAAPPNPGGQHTAHRTDLEPDATIHLAESPDFGRTWRVPRVITGAACPCCRIALARNGWGRGVASWRHHFPGDVRDIVVADLGDSIDRPEILRADGWVYPGCPHAGPALAAAGRQLHVVWYTGKPGASGMFYAVRDGDSIRVVPLVTGPTVPTAHGTVALLEGRGAIVAWDLAAGAAGITIAAIDSTGAETWRESPVFGARGHHPQAVAVPGGWVVVAWTGITGGRTAIRLARVH